MSTYQILQQAAQSWPERTAIIDRQGSISYHALYQQTETLKSHLLQAGLSKGMGLGVMGRNGRYFIAAMFAGMACEAIVLPLSHQLKQAEIADILSDTKLHAVIDDQSGVTPINNRSSLLIDCLQQCLRLTWCDISIQQPLTKLTDAAFIRYTSGTTGTSKGVVLSHRSIKARVNIAQVALNLNINDAVLWVLPMAFHFLVTILVYIRSGVLIIVCKDLLAKSIIQAANQHKATLLYASPIHFRLLATDLSKQPMTTLKYAISTSSGLPITIAKAFKQRFGIQVSQAYGVIEAGLPLLDNNLLSEIDSSSVGYPVTGFTVALLDQYNNPVAEGEIGHLAIRGLGLFDAYLKPWQTAEQVMNNGWFMTGDLAQRKANGRFYIVGREKTLINVSGNKVFPEEVEAVLNMHTEINDSHVFSQIHPLMGEIVCAEVVVENNINLDVEQVIQFCRHQLSTYKIPQRLKQVLQIKRTESGKIVRIL